MSAEQTHGRTLTVRLPTRLDAELERLAARESNSRSAVARRILAAGLAREARISRDVDGSDEERLAS
jgi:predicted transcriptional regulator